VAAVGEERRRGSSAGVLDLYRALLDAGRTWLGAARRRRLAIAVEISLIVLYIVLRTLDTSRFSLQLWTIATAIVAIVSPTSGLVVLAAIAPFSEPLTITRQLGVKPLLAVAIGLGTLIRVLIWAWGHLQTQGLRSITALPRTSTDRRLALVAASLASAAMLLIGTGLGVVHTTRAFDGDFANAAAQTWLAGIGGGLILFLCAALAGASGTIRPLVAAVCSAVVGGVVSLIDYVDGGAIRGAVVDWLLRPNRLEGRLTGIIPSPNAVEALLISPTVLLIAIAVLGRDVRLRSAALVALVPLGIALYFTYSRAALIGVFVAVVVTTWSLRRHVGIAVLLIGIVAGIALLPTYIQARASQVGPQAAPRPGEIFIATDAWRLRAWGAATRMWLDEPLVGHGFLSYQALHEAYGDPMLRSPHNEWLRFFAEEGALVGLGALAFVGVTAGALSYGRGAIGVGTLAAFLAFIAATLFNNPFLFVQVLAIAFTIAGVGVGCIAGRRTAAALPSVPTPSRRVRLADDRVATIGNRPLSSQDRSA
jgi:hypothetical protein